MGLIHTTFTTCAHKYNANPNHRVDSTQMEKKSNDKAKQMKLRLFKNNKKKNLRGEKNGHKNSAKMII